MALWQFDASLIPCEVIGTRETLTKIEFEEPHWHLRQPPHDYSAVLSRILSPTDSWSEDLLVWGTHHSDVIKVWLENGQVDCASVRIDCRELNPKFIRAVFDLAADWNCRLIYDRYRKVLPQDLEGFIRAIWDSPSHQWMRNPEKWLPKLAAEVKQMEDER